MVFLSLLYISPHTHIGCCMHSFFFISLFGLDFVVILHSSIRDLHRVRVSNFFPDFANCSSYPLDVDCHGTFCGFVIGRILILALTEKFTLEFSPFPF
jgi:hypothetical protein